MGPEGLGKKTFKKWTQYFITMRHSVSRKPRYRSRL
jgi:hypothetical protein